MASILELFESNPDLGQGSTYDPKDIVKEYDNKINPKAPTSHNPENFFEQELHGIRVTSKVDFNNPLIYGTDTPRIISRSTRTLETMIEGRNSSGGDSGLIGKGLTAISGGKVNSINQVRNKIGDFIGLPQPYIPTVVSNLLEPGVSVQDILDRRNGTEVGKLLRGGVIGGKPETIVKQSLGTAITFGKDKLRSFLLGTSPTLGDAIGDTKGFEGYYTDQRTYIEVQKEFYDYGTEIESKEDFAIGYELAKKHIKPINLAEISPIYGVGRGSAMWDTELGNRIKEDRGSNTNLWRRLTPYDATDTYTGGNENQSAPIVDRSLDNKYKLTSQEDGLNLISPSKTDLSLEEREDMDLIPFWIGKVGPESDTQKKTHFRTLLSGISETVTPNWGETQFAGNPFSFYTYSGVGRELTFSLMIYCSNPVELAYNWEKINALTKYTYPEIGENGLVNPPIIDFRIGDIYKDKIGYISSLSYTFPDNGTWETDMNIGLLPKFIEVSVSIHFIEQHTDVANQLYGYDISETAMKNINDANGASNFSTDSSLQSNGTRVTNKPIKVTKKGMTQTSIPAPKIPKTLGGKFNSPNTLLSGLTNPITSQTGINDKIGGNATEAINLAQGKDNLTDKQSTVYVTSLKPMGFEPYTGHGMIINPGDKVYKDEFDNVAVLYPDGNFDII